MNIPNLKRYEGFSKRRSGAAGSLCVGIETYIDGIHTEFNSLGKGWIRVTRDESIERKKIPPTSKQLLDMFLDDEWVEGDTPVERMSDTEFVDYLLKRKAKRNARQTLDRYRKDEPLPTPPEISPVKEEDQTRKISPIKTCRNCYFCTNFRVIGVDWYAICSNTGRSRSAEGSRLWIKAERNLSCWRKKE